MGNEALISEVEKCGHPLCYPWIRGGIKRVWICARCKTEWLTYQDMVKDIKENGGK